MAFEYALALCTQVSPLIRVAGQFIFPFASQKQDWKKHWYFLTLTRLHSTTVSEWNFVLDSALERAWKITWVKSWECRKLTFILFLFYSITRTIVGGKARLKKALVFSDFDSTSQHYGFWMKFVLDSALERAWKITWVESWECRKLSFVLFLFYSITSKISGGKKIWDTLQKQSAHKLNCSRLFYLVSMRAKTF